MVVAVLVDLSRAWACHVRDAAGERATILQARSPDAGVELLQSVPADLVVVELPEFTRRRLDALSSIRAQAGEAVCLCIAPEDVIAHVRREGIDEPALWLRADASADDRADVLAQALEMARLRAEMEATLAGPGRSATRANAHLENGTQVTQDREPRLSADLDVLHRLMAGLTGGFDLDRLLEACVDSVTRFSQCASYCLLWEAPDGGLRVRSQRGIPGEVVEDARLASCDALPTWYRRNRRVLTLGELRSWPDRQLAVQVAREMALFGGQIALPLMVRGRLAGILMLGEKVLGESYGSGEVEMLFAVTSYVAMTAEGIELHEELERSKAYADRIVESMGAGMVTLGRDERIAVCNPYAAEVLDLDRAAVEGSDLRALPSPLGDMLFAALRAPERASPGEEVAIRGGEVVLRVTTAALLDDRGEPLGSVLMLDDITAEKQLARERSRIERLDVLNRIVGRIAHEVKNPLTAVKTYAELISGRGSDQRLAQFWSQTVLPEIDHLDELLKNLLRMVEQPEPHVEPARLEDLIEQALSVVPIAEEVKRQAFDLQFEKDLPTVLVDPAPTRDALSYLMSYLAGSRPFPVEVDVTRDADDPSLVLVTMVRRSRMNGVFDPDTVFDPLYAMQNPESDLGPVISQKIITNQNGWVQALSDDGRVTMRVALPRSQDGVQASPEV